MFLSVPGAFPLSHPNLTSSSPRSTPRPSISSVSIVRTRSCRPLLRAFLITSCRSSQAVPLRDELDGPYPALSRSRLVTCRQQKFTNHWSKEETIKLCCVDVQSRRHRRGRIGYCSSEVGTLREPVRPRTWPDTTTCPSQPRSGVLLLRQPGI